MLRDRTQESPVASPAPGQAVTAADGYRNPHSERFG
jgi:hypothetical protein